MNTGPSMGLEASLDRRCQSVLADEVSLSEACSGIQTLLGEAVIDRYRCPQDLIDVVSSETPSSGSGFFRFGQDGICYGRPRSAILSSRPEPPLHDATIEVAVENKKLLLPFNLKEVIDNLRLERYKNGEATDSNLFRLCKKVYYYLRPFTNQMVRKQVQKFHARN